MSCAAIALQRLSSRDADLRDRSRIRDVIVESRPDWILLSAAYTDVDGLRVQSRSRLCGKS